MIYYRVLIILFLSIFLSACNSKNSEINAKQDEISNMINSQLRPFDSREDVYKIVEFFGGQQKIMYSCRDESIITFPSLNKARIGETNTCRFYTIERSGGTSKWHKVQGSERVETKDYYCEFPITSMNYAKTTYFSEVAAFRCETGNCAQKLYVNTGKTQSESFCRLTGSPSIMLRNIGEQFVELKSLINKAK